ncbi:MAG: hypothetical protein BGO98_16980 [Myxococcales bacterium 68-20]|nr:MAG: hypothetical protein BGO98_16980 [Myxococcales bacterium 68-20]
MAGCNQDWLDSLSAWHDGEVTPEDRRRVEQHLADCAPCRRAAAMLGNLRSALVTSAERAVPERVRERAEAAVHRRVLGRRKWLATGAVASAVVAAAAAVLFMLRPTSTLTPSLADELVSHHWTGFTRERPCDFESSDPEAVSGWLEDHLGYPVSVSVPPGARLIGARLCRITDTRTAAVMYRMETSALTVFVPPQSSPAATMARSFATDGVRCMNGALGSAICIRNEGPQPMLAVADTQPSLLARALAPSH